MPAFAQSTGLVKGKVTDSSNQPVDGASVVIEFADGMNRKYEVKTNRKGEFIQIGLAPATTRSRPRKRASASSPSTHGFGWGPRSDSPSCSRPPGPAARRCPRRTSRYRKLFQEGITALNANNFDEALAKFQSTSTLRADCFQCYLGLGEAYRGKEDWASAEANYKKAAELKPDAPEPYRDLRDLSSLSSSSPSNTLYTSPFSFALLSSRFAATRLYNSSFAPSAAPTQSLMD